MSKHVRALREMALKKDYSEWPRGELVDAADALEIAEIRLRQVKKRAKAMVNSPNEIVRMWGNGVLAALELQPRRVGAPKPAAGKRGRG